MGKFYRPITRIWRGVVRKVRATITGENHIAKREIAVLMHREYDRLRSKPGVSGSVDFDDKSLVDRIIASYRNVSATGADASAMWEYIFNTKQKSIHESLMTAQPGVVSKILARPGDSNLFFGFDGTTADLGARMAKDKTRRDAGARYVHDHLLRVAEVIGAVRYENPEDLRSRLPAMSVENILEALDEALGVKLEFPNPFPDEYGVETNRGIINLRAVHAIYQAWRIRELVENIENPKILEIGGGLGRTAFYARQLGIKDYTIIDLPFTGVSQASFLMRTIGEDAVVIHGEALNGKKDAVKLLRPPAFLNTDERYNLIVNIDSMTEMGEDAATDYWNKIKITTSMFLSINHELNPFTVWGLAKKLPSGITRKQRYTYAIRRGYLEETFEFLSV